MRDRRRQRAAAGPLDRPRSIPTGSSCTRPAGDRPCPFGLAHLSLGPHEATCIGVFRDFQRPVYGEAMYAQLERATERLGKGDLATLLHGGDTWTVG